jgi:hypothetical protein
MFIIIKIKEENGKEKINEEKKKKSKKIIKIIKQFKIIIVKFIKTVV